MPIYEYECPKCELYLEVFYKNISDVKKERPKCYMCKVEMNKLISKSSFSLKGGGWYKDGYTRKRNNGE